MNQAPQGVSTPISQRKDKAVYSRIPADLVAWLDLEAKRQRRSRAFVMIQAIQVLRTVRRALEMENPT